MEAKFLASVFSFLSIFLAIYAQSVGEKHKIEAHIKVRHALKVHEGKYQCNTLHSSYHMLHVRSPLHANDNQLSTETIVYETIHDLTPSSSAENIFPVGGTWAPVVPVSLPPTRTTQQHRKHHHHHHSTGLQQQQHQPNHFQDQQQQHKVTYMNATNFDGQPRISGGNVIGGIGVSESNESGGPINVEHLPPTQYNELTTVSWSGRTKKPPPQYPPPRTTSSLPPSASVSSSSSLPQSPDEYYRSVTPITAPNSNNIHRYQQQQNANFPLQTIHPSYQTPMLTTYQQLLQPTRQAAPQYTQTAVYPPHQQQQQQQQGGGYTYAPFMPPILTTSNTGTTISIMLPPTLQQQEQQVNKPISKEPDFLVPNYDNAALKIKVYEIRHPLVLSCNITKEGDFTLTWEKNGTEVSKVESLKKRYEIKKEVRQFIIPKTDQFDDGLYSCVLDNQRADFNVIARVVVRVPSNTGVVEGEKLTIVCTVLGTDPQLSWTLGNSNDTITNISSRYTLKADENHVENAILQVENISLEDRGDYRCSGRNAANNITAYQEVAYDVSYVRVKGKLAALWPFLGICAEVLILCSIILIYEKRRNSSELDESDTDPQEQKKKRRSYD